MDIQQRDATYHRRIIRISTIVVAVVGIVLFFAQRIVRREYPNFVGYSAMELVPEIVIEPETAAPTAAPAPKPQPVREDVARDLAEQSEFETAPPVKSAEPRPVEPDILDLEARGASLSKTARTPHNVPYSNTFIILRQVKPKYPSHERDAGIEGSVTVELLVDERGFVDQANVLSLVGPASFQDSALEAVRQFVFQPPVENGESTAMWIKFVIKFRMYN